MKDFSLDMFHLILLYYDRLYQKSWQFSCHLITGRNVKNLSMKNVLPLTILFEYEYKCKFIRKGMAVQLP